MKVGLCSGYVTINDVNYRAKAFTEDDVPGKSPHNKVKTSEESAKHRDKKGTTKAINTKAWKTLCEKGDMNYGEIGIELGIPDYPQTVSGAMNKLMEKNMAYRVVDEDGKLVKSNTHYKGKGCVYHGCKTRPYVAWIMKDKCGKKECKKEEGGCISCEGRGWNPREVWKGGD